MSDKSRGLFRNGRCAFLVAAAGVVWSAAVVRAGAPGSDAETARLAKELAARAQVHRGVCAVLGCDGRLAIDLARTGELLVHVRDPRPAAVAALRTKADEAGLAIDRLAIEQGGLDRLPYADNLVDVVVATPRPRRRSAELPVEEMLRVARPQGTVFIPVSARDGGLERDMAALKKRSAAARAASMQIWESPLGNWLQLTKQALQATDDWPHWEHGPDNNPVSGDRVIKAPYMTQFLAGPLYIGMPSITTAAGGRTFLAVGHIAHHRREWDMLNKIIARNGYNGTILWQRDLPEGYMVHRSAFYATADTFHMIDGDRCLLLDAQTGKERGEIRIPGVDGEWKWMAFQDGILYVLSGKPGPGAKTVKGDRTFGGWSWADLSEGYYQQPRVPWGFGHTLAAYDLEKERTLWKHREEEPIDSRALALGGNRVFLYCPEKHLRCVDAATGQLVWTNGENATLDLIEQPGRGLASTPGFRSLCLAVYTPKALIVQGQTRMNVVAVSTDDGSLLWTKRKVTNNPNAIYVDGRVVVGVGPGGSHVAVDPVSGEVLEDFGFRKVSCTRLTASSDSFFCRGEGTLRFDRRTKRVLIDGAIRPACNDGAIPANGMLYIGPWSCDCNLSLIGACGKCSAGDFRFDRTATEEDRLERGQGDVEQVAPLETAPEDWPTYRANNRRSAATAARLARPSPPAAEPRMTGWHYTPQRPHVPTAPTSAGGLVFVAGHDGKVRAIDAARGTLRWQFATPSPVKAPPTVAEGRAYFGSSDGYVYALEAATGRLLWRFRAAPVERHIMLYGNLASTWPVNTGVLLADGVAYFAAGIIDQDGTYVYALDAATGKIKWQNNSSGHLNEDLRKGVSAQGCLAVQGGQLLLAGGNQVSPARFDLATGECLAAEFSDGRPKANAGRFVGVLDDEYAVVGGRILYSDPRNVATKASFLVTGKPRGMGLNFGGVPPAWSDNTLAMVNFRHGKITCCDTAGVAAQIEKGFPAPTAPRRSRWRTVADLLAADGAVRWQSDLGEPNKFEALSLAICPAAVVAAVQYQDRIRARPQWFVAALDADTGTPYWFWRHELGSEPLPGGLLVDRQGRVVVTMLNGDVLCLVPAVPPNRS